MGAISEIEWCKSTWNPWRGCRMVGPGCANCYMFRAQRRYGRDPLAVVRSKTTFTDPLKWKDGRLVFSCSWSDFFIEEADEWRDAAWDIIRQTPRHTYQVLTKRPERILGHLPPDWPLANVWLGVTVEDCRHGLPRIDILRGIPAAVRFISAEPLLEDIVPVDLEDIHWVIVGGESGPRARRMAPAWARHLRDRCLGAGVPMFFKQWGEFDESGRRVGRKTAGRILDGRCWNGMPAIGVAGAPASAHRIDPQAIQGG